MHQSLREFLNLPYIVRDGNLSRSRDWEEVALSFLRLGLFIKFLYSFLYFTLNRYILGKLSIFLLVTLFFSVERYVQSSFLDDQETAFETLQITGDMI